MAGEAPREWVGDAFGLSIASEFELPGFERELPGGGVRRLRLSAAGADQAADVRWGERVQEWRYPDGPIGLAIDCDPTDGYRFYVRDVGVFHLSMDGTHAACAPAPRSGWHWRRYLIGQVLPFAALLQGLEVFHASAVEIAGVAVGLVGPSGVGKSTLALNMHLEGHGFLTDDVLAMERGPAEIVAYPGVATAKLRQRARALVRGGGQNMPGGLISEDEHEARYEVERSAEPLPLGVICMLERSDDAAGIDLVEEPADPWRLLASTFNLLVQDAERLRGQLDLCAEIAARVRFLRVRVPARPGPEDATRLASGVRSLVSRERG